MKLYTKTVCPKCIGVKSKIEEEEATVELINIDHDEAAKQKLIDQNILTVPVLEVNDQLISDLNTIYATLESGV